MAPKYLVRYASQVLRVNPSALRRLGVKTDKLDAKTMAEQAALGVIRQVWVSPAYRRRRGPRHSHLPKPRCSQSSAG